MSFADDYARLTTSHLVGFQTQEPTQHHSVYSALSHMEGAYMPMPGDKLEAAAFKTAFHTFKQLEHLTRDEEWGMQSKLKEYIHTLRVCGETDPEKMASSVVALVRQFEQIMRSQGRIASVTPLSDS